jgi:hypothetical protein
MSMMVTATMVMRMVVVVTLVMVILLLQVVVGVVVVLIMSMIFSRWKILWKFLFDAVFFSSKCPNRFDGALGIIVPIAAAKAVAARSSSGHCTAADDRVGKCSVEEAVAGIAQFKRPFEVIAFADEEGVRCVLITRGLSGMVIEHHGLRLSGIHRAAAISDCSTASLCLKVRIHFPREPRDRRHPREAWAPQVQRRVRGYAFRGLGAVSFDCSKVYETLAKPSFFRLSRMNERRMAVA